MIKLYPLKEFTLPVVAECINPDVFKGKGCEEIAKLKVWEGNKQRSLKELLKLKRTKQKDLLRNL